MLDGHNAKLILNDLLLYPLYNHSNRNQTSTGRSGGGVKLGGVRGVGEYDQYTLQNSQRVNKN